MHIIIFLIASLAEVNAFYTEMRRNILPPTMVRARVKNSKIFFKKKIEIFNKISNLAQDIPAIFTRMPPELEPLQNKPIATL